jgi:pimeloyl-ACP methyl ester carboxylesterase
MERWVDVPGGRLFVVDEGAGPPIVLLHPGIGDLRAWDLLAPILVASGYRAIRYDRRGFGRSTTDDVPFSNRADAIAVLDALEVERAVLVGNSAGGQVAFDTAIEHPGRIVAVVGVAAGLGGFEGEPTADEIALFEELERNEEAEDPDVDAVVELDLRLWVDGPGQPPDRVAPAVRDLVRAMDAPLYGRDRPRGRPIVLDPPADARLADLRCPVLAIAGDLDVSDVAQTAHHLAERAPDAGAVILPGVAHVIELEAPEPLARLILTFLEPRRPWS